MIRGDVVQCVPDADKCPCFLSEMDVLCCHMVFTFQAELFSLLQREGAVGLQTGPGS